MLDVLINFHTLGSDAFSQLTVWRYAQLCEVGREVRQLFGKGPRHALKLIRDASNETFSDPSDTPFICRPSGDAMTCVFGWTDCTDPSLKHMLQLSDKPFWNHPGSVSSDCAIACGFAGHETAYTRQEATLWDDSLCLSAAGVCDMKDFFFADQPSFAHHPPMSGTAACVRKKTPPAGL